MNEMDILSTIRNDVPPMSEQARLAGRRTLEGQPKPRPSGRRRLALAGAGVVALTLGITATQVVQLGDSPPASVASAADLLHQAAETAARQPSLDPRPDQYIYIHSTWTEAGTDASSVQAELWQSVDGTREGEWRFVVTHDDGTFRNGQGVSVYDPDIGLTHAPYSVLAELPDEPRAMLNRIYQDPYVRAGAPTKPYITARNELAWELIRLILRRPVLPPAQQAAIYGAAALIPGIELVDGVTDAAGREGVAVRLRFNRARDHRELIFDAETKDYLGSRIVEIDKEGKETVTHSTAVTKTGVVDEIGQVPS